MIKYLKCKTIEWGHLSEENGCFPDFNWVFSFRARSLYLYCLFEQGHFFHFFHSGALWGWAKGTGSCFWNGLICHTGYHDHHGYHGYHDYHGSNTQPFIFQRQYRNTLLNLNVMFSSDHSIYIHSHPIYFKQIDSIHIYSLLGSGGKLLSWMRA